jgi:methyl-accepting chemotaxis protein
LWQERFMRRGLFSFSIKSAGLCVCVVIAGIVGYGFVTTLQGLTRQVELTDRAAVVAKAIDHFTSALTAMSLERSVTQVGLSLDDPLPANFRGLLDGQRRMADEHLAKLEAAIPRASTVERDRAFWTALAPKLDELATLRRQADQALSQARQARSGDSRQLPRNLMNLFSRMARAGDTLRDPAVLNAAGIGPLDLAQQRAWMIREYGGRSRTFFAISVLHDKPMPVDEMATERELFGLTTQPLDLLERSAAMGTLTPAVVRAIADVKRAYGETYSELRRKFYTAADTGSYPFNFETYFRQSTDVFNTVEGLMTLAGREMVSAADHANARAWNELYKEFVIATVQLAIVAFLFWLVMFRISGRINRLTGVMNKLAADDLSVQPEAMSGHDEIGRMADALTVFKTNALRLKDMDGERAALEARTQEERRAEMRALAAEFEQTAGHVVTRVAAAAGELQTSARALSTIADETNRQSQNVAASAEEATANVQTVAAASEELSASIREISRQVDQSSQIAAKAAKEASETTHKVRTLADAAEKIGSIVALINDIAGRTNLLALNATIEAARAGEAGKGFAVVASEVKSLADQTAKATSEIAGQIGAIQSSTGAAAGAIEGIGRTIQEINAIASSIAAAVEEQGAATTEIARNVQQASQGTGDVSASIVSVTRAATDASGASGQVLAAADDLSKQADHLRGAIGAFLGKVKAA